MQCPSAFREMRSFFCFSRFGGAPDSRIAVKLVKRSRRDVGVELDLSLGHQRSRRPGLSRHHASRSSQWTSWNLERCGLQCSGRIINIIDQITTIIMSRPSSSKLERLLPHLYATRSEFPFGANGPGTRAFLLQRRSSTDNSTVTMKNVWVYGSSFVGDYLQHLEELGGVTMQLLNHRDEASKYCNVLPAPVFSHELEAQSIRNKHSRVDLTYSGAKHTFDDDLIAYHTPGTINAFIMTDTMFAIIRHKSYDNMKIWCCG